MPSSVIQDWRYDPAERRLRIRFQTGRRYAYLAVPPEIARGLAAASSKGEFFNEAIRDHFAFERE